MPSCECCWTAYRRRQMFEGADISYETVVAEHEANRCLCAKDTEEGRRRAAGQFWDEEKKIDVRRWPERIREPEEKR